MAITVLDSCTGCGSCFSACRYSALSLETELPRGFGRKRAVVDMDLCRNCKGCISACPHLKIVFSND